MKKLNLFILFIAVIITSSCSSDDDSGNNKDDDSVNLIIGTWQIKSIVENEISMSLSDCRKKSNYVFKSDNSYVNEDFVEGPIDPCIDDGLFGTYAIVENKITFTENVPGEQNDIITYEFEIKNNELIIIDNDTDSNYREVYSKK